MAKNLVTRNTEVDLRTAYLLAFDNFSTTPVEVGNAVNGNSRYGRELLATLVNGGLICSTFVNNDEEVWQTLQTYDSIDRAEAIRIFEQWLNSQAPEAPKEIKPVTNLAECKCGCGELANKNRDYRPGHDARHAGVIGRAMATEFAANRADKAEALLVQLPSAALRIKAKGVALKAAEGKSRTRKATKSPKVEAPTTEIGTLKIGRWTYPAVRHIKSGQVRWERKDGSTVLATAKQAPAFKAN